MAFLQFDSTGIEPSKPLELIPANTEVVAAIEASEMKPTSAGTGAYLALTFVILDGPYKGRKLWTNLNLSNPNPTAVEIAQKDLAAICLAVGRPRIGDSSELHNLPMALVVGISPAKGDFEASNKIKSYAAVNRAAMSGAPAMAPVAAPIAQPQYATGGYAQPQPAYQPPPVQPVYQPAPPVANPHVPAGAGQAPPGWTPAPQAQPPVAPPPTAQAHGFQLPPQAPAGQFQAPPPPFQPVPQAPVEQVAPPQEAAQTEAPTPPWAQGG